MLRTFFVRGKKNNLWQLRQDCALFDMNFNFAVNCLPAAALSTYKRSALNFSVEQLGFEIAVSHKVEVS